MKKTDTSLKIDPICILLSIDFWEILQEYFFVQNQFLILKNELEINKHEIIGMK